MATTHRAVSHWLARYKKTRFAFVLELLELGDDALRSRDERCGGCGGQPAAVHQGVDFVDEGLEHSDRVRGVTRPQVAERRLQLGGEAGLLPVAEPQTGADYLPDE